MPPAIATAKTAAFRASLIAKGETITYERNGTVISVGLAIRGQTDWPAESAFDGAMIHERSTDWLLMATDDNGDTWEPARGDTITDENGVVFQVLPFGATEQTFRFHDRGRTIYRVYSKERA